MRNFRLIKIIELSEESQFTDTDFLRSLFEGHVFMVSSIEKSFICGHKVIGVTIIDPLKISSIASIMAKYQVEMTVYVEKYKEIKSCN